MSGYGPPQTQQSGSKGPGLGLPATLGYAAGGLGVLASIWGFLEFYSPDEGDGSSGYASVGTGAGIIALTVLAGLIAAAQTYEGKPVSSVAAAAAAGGVLVIFGTLVDTPDGVDAGVGLILALITALAQTVALVYAWLLGTGKVKPPQPKPKQPQAPQGYGQPGQQGPQGYGAPQAYGQPQGPPPGAPQGQPHGAPQGPPHGAPQGPPHGTPQGQPPGAPQGPPPGYSPPSPYGQPGPSSSSGGQPPSPGGYPPPPPSPYGPPPGQQGH